MLVLPDVPTMGARLDLASPYLLAAVAYCTECSGALIAQTRDFKKECRHVYGSAYHQKRGKEVCGNGVQIAHAIMDREVLARSPRHSTPG